MTNADTRTAAATSMTRRIPGATVVSTAADTRVSVNASRKAKLAATLSAFGLAGVTWEVDGSARVAVIPAAAFVA